MLRKQSHILFVALFAVLQVQALSKFRKKAKKTYKMHRRSRDTKTVGSKWKFSFCFVSE